MVDSELLFWLAPGIFGVFAACFAAMSLSARDYEPPRWAAVAGFVAMFGALIDILRPASVELSLLLSGVLHWLTLVLISQSLLTRHHRSMPLIPMAVALVAATVVAAVTIFVRPAVEVRIALNGAMGALIIGCAILKLRGAGKSAIDRTVVVFLGICAAIYIVRPAVFLLFDPLLEEAASAYPFAAGSMVIFYMTTIFTGLGVLLIMMLAMGNDLIRREYDEARIDTLTGIGNRRAHSDILEAARNSHRSVEAAIVVDLDHFKRINDAFGHEAGDRVLVAAAKAMARAAAGRGQLCRIGGEEFALLLDRANATDAVDIAEAIAAAVRGAPVHRALPEVKLTASVGWARRASGESPQELVRRADQAVFAAKRQGRDRVCGHDAEFQPLRLVEDRPSS